MYMSWWLNTHTHPLTALCPVLPGWAGTRKVKPIWIFLKQETVSGSGISWAICKSAPHSRQITMPALHHFQQFFTGRMPFLPPNQQCQSTLAWQLTQHTHTRLTALCPRLPGWAGTRKVKPIWILLQSKRQWVAVASAGSYASLHLAPDRQTDG